jgi:hypothetical protein
MAITPKPTLFIDSTVQNFQGVFDLTYKTSKDELETATKELALYTEDLEVFAGDVRLTGHNYQNSKVDPIPPVNELKRQKNEALKLYHGYKALLIKMDSLEKKIPRMLVFLSAAPQEDESLKTYIPLLHTENECSNQTCTSYFSKLEEIFAVFQQAKLKFKTPLDGRLYSDVHRLCGIFDNTGLPLGMFARSGNYMLSSQYPIPLPEGGKIEIPALRPRKVEVQQKPNSAPLPQVKQEKAPPLSGARPVFKSTSEEFDSLFSSSTTGEEDTGFNEAGSGSLKITGEPAKPAEPPVQEAAAVKTEKQELKFAELPALPTVAPKAEQPKLPEPLVKETIVVKTENQEPKPQEPPVLDTAATKTETESPTEEPAPVKTENQETKPQETPVLDAAVAKTEAEVPTEKPAPIKTENQETKPTEPTVAKTEATENAPKEQWPTPKEGQPTAVRTSSRNKKHSSKNATEPK